MQAALRRLSTLTLALQLVAAAACRDAGSDGALDLSKRPTPSLPTLTAAVEQLPAIVATVVAAEPPHQVVQLEFIYADEGSPQIAKVSAWVNAEGQRREESSPESLYNPGVVSVDDLETVSRYNPSTRIFNRNPRGIVNIVDQPPFAKNLLEKSRFGEVSSETVEGRKTIRLDGMPEDDPLRRDAAADFTVWIDAETHRIVRTQKIVRPELGPPFVITSRVVAYDPPADEGRFRLDPPQDPDLLLQDAVANPVAPVEMGIDEARKAVPYPVYTLTNLPENISLLGTTVTQAEAGAIDPAVVQFFVRGEQEGFLVLEQFAADAPGSARAKARLDLALRLGEKVKIGDQEAVYVDRLGSRYLLWQTDRTRVKLSANRPELDREALLSWAGRLSLEAAE